MNNQINTAPFYNHFKLAALSVLTLFVVMTVYLSTAEAFGIKDLSTADPKVAIDILLASIAATLFVWVLTDNKQAQTFLHKAISLPLVGFFFTLLLAFCVSAGLIELYVDYFGIIKGTPEFQTAIKAFATVFFLTRKLFYSLLSKVTNH